MNKNKTNYLITGFTLIELLVVFSVIAVLLGIIIPTYFGARDYAKQAKAQSDIKNIETALLEYETYYQTWPDSVIADENTAYPMEDDLYLILQGENIGDDNPDEKVFIEYGRKTESIPDEYTNSALDPWKFQKGSKEEAWQPYLVQCDLNYDHRIKWAGNDREIKKRVLVWTPGPDRTNATGDDIKSW
jgi:prepilin-type N-terminal cleavage/methylation domain-containing protein